MFNNRNSGEIMPLKHKALDRSIDRTDFKTLWSMLVMLENSRDPSSVNDRKITKEKISPAISD